MQVGSRFNVEVAKMGSFILKSAFHVLAIYDPLFAYVDMRRRTSLGAKKTIGKGLYCRAKQKSMAPLLWPTSQSQTQPLHHRDSSDP